MKLYTCIPILPLTFAASALGFTLPAASSRSSRSRAGCPHLHSQVLNDMDLMCIMNTASYCLEEHCPVDDTEALMNTMADQEYRLCQRVANLNQALQFRSQTALAYVNANKLSLLNDMDLMCMINVANYCEDQQACSLDDRDAVMYTLSQQREAATSRVAQLAHNMADIIKLENAPGRDVQSLLMALQNILSADQLAMV